VKIISPKRRKHSCNQIWKGNVSSVFPLLCPVREIDWIPDWEPNLVVSDSGLMEKNCLFTENESENEAIWIVTQYEKDKFVDMYRVLPGVTVSQFSISLDIKNQNSTSACISYEHTALSEAGEKVVDDFTEENFLSFMSHFELAINHYLVTGEKIKG